ncbi:MAG: Hsp20/alpha crystallin family protein [Deltaproteobacteria bacterium]|nr:Hsp20/alpha crystallin family protein [Deltaproteobacteria bacterium]
MADEEKHEHKGVSGFLSGFTELLEKLEKLAETGGEISRTGSFPAPQRTQGTKPTQGVYGFSVKMGGLGGKDFKVEPFGNVRRDRATGRSVVEEAREPLVDVFDEDERLLIVAEMPGIEPEDVHIDLSDHTLTLSAQRADRRYRKSIEVPEGTRREGLSVSCRNGIIEISAAKQRA